ncbi:hypothetical protein E6W39_04240 [Kitasatospora acidiphila]|uniref:Low molecular weight antigen MTB12-like C-terminal domain-containing protein n=1 Tax=Kitasatospora acidiphila TaxID=2567942 RepID=A0A540VXV9_9ACTN|nr:hypothetical protein [Kitasatospora acidiphila]TQF01595.1 hypothetical protein E6W39_04240 [Kitasatospora acidiphila]
MRKDLVIRAAGAVLGAALLVTSCSSSTKSTTTPSPTPSPTSAGLSPSPSAGPTGTAPADTAAATQQITQNWQSFFSPSTPITAKAGLLQNGTQLLPVLQSFANDPRVGQISAQVTNVQFTSATMATVTYNLSLQGQTVQPNAAGQAVLENGTWKVSDSTLCALVAQAGASAVPGCSS